MERTVNWEQVALDLTREIGALEGLIRGANFMDPSNPVSITLMECLRERGPTPEIVELIIEKNSLDINLN